MEKHFELGNSVHIPSVGFGTWQTPDGATAVDAVRCAIEAGYRHTTRRPFMAMSKVSVRGLPAAASTVGSFS